MENLRLLAINSLASHGMASLKTYLSILGNKVIPVPSILLNGLTNMAYVHKQYPDFESLLESTFELATYRNLKLIVCIGYLGTPDQVKIIENCIEKYRQVIQTLLTDPICGDQGRAYVSPSIISAFPSLIRKSHFAFPNETELKMITGYAPDDTQPLDVYIQAFEKKYPETCLIVTGIQQASEIATLYKSGSTRYEHRQRQLPWNQGGTGDAFVAHFINHYYFGQEGIEETIYKSCKAVEQSVQLSIDLESDELLLHRESAPMLRIVE